MNDTDRRAIIRVLRLSPIVDEIQQTLDARRGRHLSVSVEAALFALIAAAGKGQGHAARLHRCAAMLRCELHRPGRAANRPAQRTEPH